MKLFIALLALVFILTYASYACGDDVEDAPATKGGPVRVLGASALDSNRCFALYTGTHHTKTLDWKFRGSVCSPNDLYTILLSSLPH